MNLSLADLPETIPIISLEGFILYPETSVGFAVTSKKAMAVLEISAKSDLRLIGINQKKGDRDIDVYPVGCAARIEGLETENDLHAAFVKGVSRFRLEKTVPGFAPFMKGMVKWAEFESDLAPPGPVEGFDRPRFIKTANRYFRMLGLPIDIRQVEDSSDSYLINYTAIYGNFSGAEKQALLELKTLPERCAALMTLMTLAAAGGKFMSRQ